MRRILLWSVGLWLMAGSVQAQDSLDVPFRYLGVEQATVPDRVFLPGEFNGWGTPYIPNTPGCIREGHPSQMEYQRRERFWQLPVRLRIGSTVQYKIQTQLGNGSTCEWFSDPLNPDINPADNNNSVLTVTDPLLFQVAEEPSAAGNMRAISAGLAGTQAFTDITFSVEAFNSFLPQGPEARLFIGEITVVADGCSDLDTREVFILVPPAELDPVG